MKEFLKEIKDGYLACVKGVKEMLEIIQEAYGAKEWLKFTLWLMLHKRMARTIFYASMYNYNSVELNEAYRMAEFDTDLDMFCIYRASKHKDMYVDTLKKLGFTQEE